MIRPVAETQWRGADIALLYRQVQLACLPYLPKLHTPEEDRIFFESVVARQSVWVAGDEKLIGFCAFRTGWIDHLYLKPEAQRNGIGSALLAVALKDQAKVHLYTFRRNHIARQFYRRQGFAEIALSDGHGNEEKEPDILLQWVAA